MPKRILKLVKTEQVRDAGVRYHFERDDGLKYVAGVGGVSVWMKRDMEPTEDLPDGMVLRTEVPFTAQFARDMESIPFLLRHFSKMAQDLDNLESMFNLNDNQV